VNQIAPLSVLKVQYLAKVKGEPTGMVREHVRVMRRQPGVVVPVTTSAWTDDYTIEYYGKPYTRDQLGYYMVRSMDGTNRVFFVHEREIVEDVT